MTEPNEPDDHPRFEPSSFSGGGDCVLVRREPGGPTAVRDSKDPNATTLTFTPAEWSAFVKGVKAGEFDPI